VSKGFCPHVPGHKNKLKTRDPVKKLRLIKKGSAIVVFLVFGNGF